MRPPSAEPKEESFLAPCPHCGSPNGLNASRCWDCETTLPSVAAGGVEPSGDKAAGLEPAAPAAGHPDSGAGCPDVGRTPASPSEDPRAALDRAFAPVRQASEAAARRRRRWLAAGVVGAGAALVVLVYPILQSPVALRVDAASRAPGPSLAQAVAPRQEARVDAGVAIPDTAVAAFGFTRSVSTQSADDAPTAAHATPTPTPTTPDADAAKPREPAPGCADAVAALGLCDRDTGPK